MLFCWKIRQGLKMHIDTERISKYAQHFWQQHLHPHFRDEEKILFAPLRDTQVQRAINEHKNIRQLVAELENHSVVNLRKRLAELADMVDDHVRYEERNLFPHIERKLSKEQLENIGRQLEKYHRLSFLDQYEDQFWNLK